MTPEGTPYPVYSGVVKQAWGQFFTMQQGSTLYRIRLHPEVNDAWPQPGEVWQIRGEPFVDLENSRYGWQFLAHEAEMIMPSGELLIDFFVMQFDGIGEAKANALWRSAADTGADLFEILDSGNAEILANLKDEKNKGILPIDLIPVVLRRWEELQAEVKAMRWMQQHGFSKRLARRAREAWGADAIDAIEDNPYRLLAFAPYRSAAKAFAKVDQFAIHRLGVTNDDKHRLMAAFECAMYLEWDKGNTAATLKTLNKRLDALLGLSRPNTENILGNAAAYLAVVLIKNTDHEPLVQLRGVAVLECSIAARCISMLERREQFQGKLFQPELDLLRLKRFETDVQGQSGSSDFVLNAEQKLAVSTALLEPLSVITGDAGTGKTTTLNALFDQILTQGGSIFPMAPTGKAAKRIRESTGQTHAGTIAKFLRDRKLGRIVPEAGSYIVIDEASMVDMVMLYEVLKFTPGGVRLILVGDPYQLPPIGAGLTFHVLAHSSYIPKTALTEVHRAAAATGIPGAARCIRELKMPTMDCLQYEPEAPGRIIKKDVGILFVHAGQNEIKNAILRVYREMQSTGDVQIIAAINTSGPDKPQIGVTNLNHSLQEVFRTAGKKVLEVTEYKKFFEDDPVIFTRNIAARDLWNGSMGRIVEIFDMPRYDSNESDEDEKVVKTVAVVELDGIKRNMTLQDFKWIELAYAITCHKAQGSAFERIIIVSYDSPTLDNSWFYTALTRARKQVAIIGDWDTMLRHVITLPKAFNRTVGLTIKRP